MSSRMWLGQAYRYITDLELKRLLKDLLGLIMILPLEILRPHELTKTKLITELAKDILSRGFLRNPLLIDLETLVILDGHHRAEALKRLGCRFALCLLVRYRSPIIRVTGWNDEEILKEDVLRAGMEGNLMPPKTTRHLVALHGGYVHVSMIQPSLNISLQKLL